MLQIKQLYAKVDDKLILKGVDLQINAGEVHVIMGPNGSGKSTFANVLAGHQNYTVTQGEVIFKGENLLEMTPEQRAHRGVFLAFQYPVEIPGVSNIYLLKASLNSIRKARGLSELDAIDFLSLVKEKMQDVDLSQEFLYRSINEGFSGGEKKRNEVLQMSLLEPTLAILDETDSGLDVDSLKTVAKGVNALRRSDRAIIIVTHYQRLLDYITPDYVHILSQGRIVKSGDRQLAIDIEKQGYAQICAEGGLT
jgi:Fe-S cluster assembly ATP-binding protein